MKEILIVLGAVSAGTKTENAFWSLGAKPNCPALHLCSSICKGLQSVPRHEANARMPECAPGVGMIWDDCKCCRKCASQKNMKCDMMNPCDNTKGLTCQKQDRNGEGICLPSPGGKTCFVQGREFGHGEEFMPGSSCTYTGICVSGDIGIFPTCSRKPPSTCESPRLCKPKKGECCGQWTCSNDPNGRQCKDEYEHEDELPFAPAYKPEDIEAEIRPEDNCYVQTTAWSPCSRDCGWGIRERISNNNKKCEMHKETKLCQIRPCDYDTELNDLLNTKRFANKMCARTVRPQNAVKFTFSGCDSEKTYRPRYCGKCKDKRCCTPKETTTEEVNFKCKKDGQKFTKKMDFVKSCDCTSQCANNQLDIFSSVKLLRDDHHRG